MHEQTRCVRIQDISAECGCTTGFQGDQFRLQMPTHQQ
ncbi:MAG: hypothetical protein IT320_08860 [Anaerolineae bacterium]|nr:hypothetical protein [Anaerolineae bacterium]